MKHDFSAFDKSMGLFCLDYYRQNNKTLAKDESLCYHILACNGGH